MAKNSEPLNSLPVTFKKTEVIIKASVQSFYVQCITYYRIIKRCIIKYQIMLENDTQSTFPLLISFLCTLKVFGEKYCVFKV